MWVPRIRVFDAVEVYALPRRIGPFAAIYAIESNFELVLSIMLHAVALVEPGLEPLASSVLRHCRASVPGQCLYCRTSVSAASVIAYSPCLQLAWAAMFGLFWKSGAAVLVIVHRIGRRIALL